MCCLYNIKSKIDPFLTYGNNDSWITIHCIAYIGITINWKSSSYDSNRRSTLCDFWWSYSSFCCKKEWYNAIQNDKIQYLHYWNSSRNSTPKSPSIYWSFMQMVYFCWQLKWAKKGILKMQSYYFLNYRHTYWKLTSMYRRYNTYLFADMMSVCCYLDNSAALLINGYMVVAVISPNSGTGAKRGLKRERGRWG